MQRATKFAIAGLLVVMGFLVWWKGSSPPERTESKEPTRASSVLAAIGRVEGREETISLGASADGVVRDVLVTDGQKVDKGALLAEIDCEDIRAEIEMDRAQAENARQSRVRLLRGHRDEERRAAAQATEAANAALTQAQQHYGRFATLEKGEISRDLIEQAKHDLEAAQANHAKAVAEQELIDAAPLPEEVKRADAEVVAAEQNMKVTANKLEKCMVRAPISGTVLKVMTKTGEAYSTFLPHPIFTIADESVRRVRAEVDERDIAKVRVGQASVVTADGYPGQKFDGQVIQISHAMKTKSVLSDDPSQKVDRDVLEVTIELNQSKVELPLGLRVTAQMNDSPPKSPEPMDLSSIPTVAPSVPTHGVNPRVISEPPAELSGFVLQVGAMTHKENADALTALLRKKSFPAFVLTREGDPYYRVDLGPYRDVAEARAVEVQLRAVGYETVVRRQFPASIR